MLLCGAFKCGEMNPQIIQNNWRMSKILIAEWSANFAIYDKHEKLTI